MRKIDFTHGIGFAILMIVSAIGFYGCLWLLMALAYMIE